jgi:HAD superfamily hydrolase (TIGR01509 family)
MFDSRKANTNFYNHILAHFGRPLMSDKEIAYVHMHTAEESIRHIFHGSKQTEEALAYRWEVDYSPIIDDMEMEPGLKDALACLACDVGLAVATNRSNTIQTVLEKHGLDMFFDLVVSSLDVRNPKPHPESLILIMKHFDVSPETVLYVGDSSVDAETARGAGVPFVAFKDKSLPARYHAENLWEVVSIALGG